MIVFVCVPVGAGKLCRWWYAAVVVVTKNRYIYRKLSWRIRKGTTSAVVLVDQNKKVKGRDIHLIAEWNGKQSILTAGDGLYCWLIGSFFFCTWTNLLFNYLSYTRRVPSVFYEHLFKFKKIVQPHPSKIGGHTFKIGSHKMQSYNS